MIDRGLLSAQVAVVEPVGQQLGQGQIQRLAVAVDQDDGVHGAPDLVVEVLSPTTARNDKTVKKAAYAKSGVREYWIVDPEGKSIVVKGGPGGHRHDFSADQLLPRLLLVCALLPLPRGRGPGVRGRHCLYRVQHRKRRIHPHQLRRAHCRVQIRRAVYAVPPDFVPVTDDHHIGDKPVLFRQKEIGSIGNYGAFLSVQVPWRSWQRS